jgi:tetratricopeptide (TPR) repeat protein
LDTALKRFPDDVLLLAHKADYQFLQQDFIHAEASYDAAIASLADKESAAYPRLLAARLICILHQGCVDRAEHACLEYLASPAKVAEKIQVVDQIVCTALYQEPPKFLPQIEQWIRKALELAPGTLTLQGTLGGILAEQGNFAEAEPLLRECRTRSTALHDQAFASLYLGKAALHCGDFKMARELFKQAMILHTEPRLLQKTELGLKACDNAGETANKTP